MYGKMRLCAVLAEALDARCIGARFNIPFKECAQLHDLHHFSGYLAVDLQTDSAFRNPDVRQATCEDYRAALNEDLILDEADHAAGRRLDCPVLVIWPGSADALAARIDIWKAWADDVTGAATTGDHLQLEDSPQEVLAALAQFLHHRKTS